MCCLLLTPQNAGKNKQAVTREGKQTGEKQKKKMIQKARKNKETILRKTGSKEIMFAHTTRKEKPNKET